MNEGGLFIAWRQRFVMRVSKMFKEIDESIRILASSLKVSFPFDTEIWLKTVHVAIDELFDMWKLDFISAFRTSHLGLLIKAYSHTKNQNVVLKIIPFFVERYDAEKNAYLSLSNKHICPLLEYSDKHNALLLHCVEPGTECDFEQDGPELRELFACMHESSLKQERQSFSYRKFYNRIINLGKINELHANIRKKYHARSEELFAQYFEGAKCYLLHGDLHLGNILRDKNHIVAVDPLGFSAPIEFAYTRFFLFQVLLGGDMDYGFETAYNFINQYVCDKDRFMAALLIDADLCVETGLVQLDDNAKMANKFMNVMDYLLTRVMR